MWKGMLSANNIQRLGYLEIINSKNYLQQMDNRWDYSGQIFLKKFINQAESCKISDKYILKFKYTW